MIRPFERITPGEGIPSSDFNRAMVEIARNARWQVASPIVITSDANGFYVAILDKPQLWVRVTGHHGKAGYYSGTDTQDSDLSRYSGIEQTDDVDTNGTYDLPGGIEFRSDGLYLKEVNGRTDVPEGAIVRAYHSNNGPYYTFLFESVPAENFLNEIDLAGNSCPFWNCFVVDTVNPFTPDCPAQYWTDTQDGPPADVSEYCGCTPLTGNISTAGCWPYWQGLDLSSTGISLQCIVTNFSGVLALRKACLVLVPGGPFGMRLALISRETGHEFRDDTQDPTAFS